MRERIDGNTIRKVRNWMKDGKEVKVFDEECVGLAIRTYKSGRASWCILTRDWKATIADLAAYSADHVPQLRDMVTMARHLKADGRDHMAFIKAFVSGRDVEGAKHVADVASGIAETWEEARDKYLASLLDDNAKDTWRSYRSALGVVPGSPLERDFAALHGKPMALVIPDDIISVIESIVERGRAKGPGAHVRQANLSLAVLKAMFKWQMGRKGNPLVRNPALDIPKRKSTSGRGGKAHKGAGKASAARALLQDEIGLIIWGLESYPNAAARTGTLLQLLTGQRRMTVAEARKSAFEEHPVYGLVWRLEDKVRAWRILPLPPTASLAVETALSLSRSDNPYLFPQQRERRAGGGMDGHINERTLSDVLEELRSPGGPLHGLPVIVSTHKLRKAFTSTMSATMHKYIIGDRRLSEKDIALITHMDEGREGTASMVYDLNPYLEIKNSILTEWEQWCLEGYYRVKARMEAAKRAA